MSQTPHFIIMEIQNTADSLIEEMKESMLLSLDNASEELFRIIKPINVTKLNYTEKIKFVSEGGFNKARKEIIKIIQAHRWLAARGL